MGVPCIQVMWRVAILCLGFTCLQSAAAFSFSTAPPFPAVRQSNSCPLRAPPAPCSLSMRCRLNQKREKRQRNRINARKFRKNKGGKGWRGRGRGAPAKVEKSGALPFQDDGWFTSQIYSTLAESSAQD